ncbi:hypothetical protein LG634_37125 [Streptomyces bambusae]|uniref:hypothetical protein n=1 Tax=Streptomyces bambusae TaxID=1550616 RepID=UPI001CFFD9F2|nr:hypothetical protein [Streptomyces bambusae]MCB5170403.1 hypothetical protein [Streptomyces bambusae]
MSAGTLVLAGSVLFMVACSSGGAGLKDEGPAARSEQAAKAMPSPAGSATPTFKRVDAVALVKADPKVSAEVKRDLKPCVGKEYPVDVTYGRVTSNSVDDVIVNVLSCADAVGVGSYVYRLSGGSYENVFADEQPPVYAEIDRGDLVVTKPVYGKSDAIAYPSGEDVITFRWTGDKFTEHDRVHTDYSNTADGGGQPAPAITPKN